ncbi:uncharacterized protein A4U43_C05F7600 [Asparagus officinalis]|uniref:RRM domain-containing protein n=1 Tax=Asparagus officinalis TaxID=4686 RepID=A0A5P1EQ19_ASPOF|nr:flowering time control protein FPA [Asparagus officinalis]ONK68115.1 uncharacterized protein A4U43_C05F7600 [Asparagus officinalis]
MMSRGVGGRARLRSEYSPRFEERERRSGWGIAPPSRSLWVGNLSTHVTQNVLSEHFLRFGDLDNISYIPGKSFAFVNYKREEDAIIAMRSLQGFNLAGMPLKIEFAKGDGASVSTQGEKQLLYDDVRQTMEQGDLLKHRDLRPQRPSLEKAYDKPKNNKSAEPNEMLWIGFPSFMNVDEMVLRRAFSPFGEIEKISAYPGRTYAFVRFKTILAACRAKEALQGKLFNNPRVNICFARGDSSAEQERGQGSDPYSSLVRSSFHPDMSGQGTRERFQRERSYESPFRGEFHMASPGFMSNLDHIARDPSTVSFDRNSSIRTNSAVPGSNFGDVAFEHGRLQELGPERALEDPYEHHRDSPAADKPAPWLDLSFERARKAPPLDPWSPESGSFSSLAKKLKTDPSPDNELPEYPFSDFEQGKRSGLPKLYPGLADQPTYGKSFDLMTFGSKVAPDPSRNIARPFIESNDSWRNFDGPSAAPGLSLQKFGSEPPQPSLSKEWKWEGTIAKGGNAICRARCFPVGKVLDFMLPETLNCTARTGLDMLAKHYYQAACSWVVFFVPATDADMSFYNEFMHFLGEKQRAAVAKLEEKVSLFLVPPSDFSEQVLKVPGKVSISGVILRFQQPSSSFSSLNNQMEAMESRPPATKPHPNERTNFHGDASFPKPSSPEFRPFSQHQSFIGSSSGRPAPLSSFPPPQKPGNNLHKENRHDQIQHQNPPFISNWSNNPPLPNTTTGAFLPPPSTAPLAEGYPPLNPKASQETSSRNYTPEASNNVLLALSKIPQQQQEVKPQVTSPMQLPLHPEQLAHLAVILGQQKQSENTSSQSGDYRQSNLPSNPRVKQSGNLQSGDNGQLNLPQVPSSQSHTSLPQIQLFPRAPQPTMGQQVSQLPQLQKQVPSASTMQQPIENPVQQSNQQASNNNGEETEADPQKRLQATLQLAAALLQQIQQQAKN